jgi:thiamine-monophosphate kinase
VEAGALAADVADVAPAARALADDGAALAWVLAGGEDHGLLATFPPGADLPEGFRRLGSVRAPAGRPRVTVDGGAPPVRPGWDHFGG